MKNHGTGPVSQRNNPGALQPITFGMLAVICFMAMGCESSQSTGDIPNRRSADAVKRPELDLDAPPAQLRQRAALEWSAAQHLGPAGDRGSVSGDISREAEAAYLRAGKYYMAASSKEQNFQQSVQDTLNAARSYIRGGRPRDALAIIMPIANDPQVDDTLRAEALYRAYQAHAARGDDLNADLALRRLKFDYPLSRWAQTPTK